MAKMKLYYTTSDKLNSLPLEDGQIIFCQDEKMIYQTFHNMRTPYSTIQIFDLDVDRRLSTPSKGFYYVKETNVLWRFEGSWVQITPEGLTPIIFGDSKEDFPEEGSQQTLYVGDEAVYKWKNQEHSYHMVANKTEWGNI